MSGTIDISYVQAGENWGRKQYQKIPPLEEWNI